MIATTFDKTLVGSGSATAETGDKAKTGFFTMLFNRLIAAREAEARRKVAEHLSNISDENLARLGISARDIEMLRHGPRVDVYLAG